MREESLYGGMGRARLIACLALLLLAAAILLPDAVALASTTTSATQAGLGASSVTKANSVIKEFATPLEVILLTITGKPVKIISALLFGSLCLVAALKLDDLNGIVRSIVFFFIGVTLAINCINVIYWIYGKFDAALV